MTFEHYPAAEKIYSDNRTVFEKIRERRLIEITKMALAGTLLLPALIFMALRFAEISAWPAWPLVAVVCIVIHPLVLLIFCLAFDHHYRDLVKRHFLSDIAEVFGFSYRRNGVMRLGDLYDHNLLPPYTTRDVEEGFSGKVNGFDIQFQDFTISTVARLGRFDYRALVSQPFYGIAIRIGLNRTFQHHTVLMPSFLANGSMRKYLNVKFTSFEDIGIVFSKFRHRYTILSESQVEARMIFDPAMIERIMKLGENLGAYWLEVSFKDREMVIIAGQTRNFFEVGTLLRPLSVLTIERVLNQIDTLKSIVDILELNPHAGLGAFRRDPSPGFVETVLADRIHNKENT